VIRIVDTHFPFVFAIVTGEVTDEDVDGMYPIYERIHQRGEKFYLAQEVRQVSIPGAPLRKKLGELNAHFGPLIERHVVGIGLVVPNRLVAGAMRAIYWLSREHSPTKFFGSAMELHGDAIAVANEHKIVFPESAETVLHRLDVAYTSGGDLSQVAVE
jgi:hypothetical protein